MLIMKQLLLICLITLVVTTGMAQTRDAYVDKEGVMRWKDTREEIYGFGVNYTAPFAHAYRTAKKLGINPEQAIDDDVYHFARLGFDAFRVHVWDTEISDSLGNLLDNDHLRLLDYLLMRLQERGIRAVLTPIAYWGNGYPEADEPTGSFAMKYGKGDCLTNEQAIQAQERYLKQFLQHVNRYTKRAYYADPDIVAFEISNEPHHRGTPASVTAFINRMVAAMRSTGCRKPIFYNVSHSVHLGEAYFKAGIQGGTFQWYPTGLGAHHELRGNFLPNVDQYTIPFADAPWFKKAAKIVYEFDAADVGRSYIYPAIARSFREAGIQWATHFAYDPTFMASGNTEYNTHYMNLVYAPQKALSLKIAGEVFHQVARNSTFGRYPANQSFGDFRVSAQEDLAVLASEKRYFYTNDTQQTPPHPDRLESLAGAGTSPVVQYKGTGAYFLDKISPGVWRLEVMPDAVWINNIFGHNSTQRPVSVVQWQSWPMTIQLPDVGTSFSVRDLRGTTTTEVKGNTFDVRPGVYLIRRAGVTTDVKADDRWKNIRLNEYVAPAADVCRPAVVHYAPETIENGKPLKVVATVVAPKMPVRVALYGPGRPWGYERFDMVQEDAYTYSATIPADRVHTGYLDYYITVENNQGGEAYTFPAGRAGLPVDWDFLPDQPYHVAVVPSEQDLYLFDAYQDAGEVSKEWRNGSGLLPGDRPGASRMLINLAAFSTIDPENPGAPADRHYALRYNFRDKIQERRDALTRKTSLVIRGRALYEPVTVEVSLVDRAGRAWGGTVTLQPGIQDYTVALASFKPVALALLPRPYPSFLPYFLAGGPQSGFELKEAETLQLRIEQQTPQQRLSVEIESVCLKD